MIAADFSFASSLLVLKKFKVARYASGVTIDSTLSDSQVCIVFMCRSSCSTTSACLKADARAKSIVIGISSVADSFTCLKKALKYSVYKYESPIGTSDAGFEIFMLNDSSIFQSRHLKCL